MPLNQLKVYAALLELEGLNDHQRTESLMIIFRRDIEDNPTLSFRNKIIRPLKKEGTNAMQTLFNHLTCVSKKVEENGMKYKKRSEFDIHRSKRLHWVKHHLDEKHKADIIIFSAEERVDGRNKIRTYIYDTKQEYVIVLEPQRSGMDYYLVTAYHLNEDHGRKAMEKRLKKKLDRLY